MKTKNSPLTSGLSRRSFLSATLATTLLGVARPNFAAQKFPLGDGELVSLSDGTWTFPNKYWVGASEAEQKKLGSMVTFGSNAYLTRRGDKIIMIDAGAGNAEFITSQFTTVGRLPIELKDAGVSRDEITDIVITHMHPDHFGGVVWGGKPMYSNATIHIDQKEWDFWTREGFATQAPEQMRPMVAMVQATAKLIKDQVQLHNGDDDLGNGMSSVAAYGHTPGHNSFLLSLGSEQVLVLGDTAVSNHIHFANPSVGWLLDSNPEAAQATRRRLFEMAVSDGLLVAGNHLNSPGIGRIERDGSAYTFVAL